MVQATDIASANWADVGTIRIMPGLTGGFQIYYKDGFSKKIDDFSFIILVVQNNDYPLGAMPRNKRVIK